MPVRSVNLPMPAGAEHVKHKTFRRRIKAPRTRRQAGTTDRDQVTRAAASALFRA
jgi:hypothetical protein